MPASPFDHPLFKGLLGDPDAESAFSAETEILTMLAFEIALADAEAASGVIPAEAAKVIRERLSIHLPPFDQVAAGVTRDGVAGPVFVALLRQRVGEPHGVHVHFGATSQDLADTSLMLRLKVLAEKFDSSLEALESELERLTAAHGDNALMGRTRMQQALPISVAVRLLAWRGPLARARGALPDDLFALQFGGPVGTLGELAGKGPEVRAALAKSLGLANAPAWHAQRDRVVQFAGWLATISGDLGKLGQDIALMAQNGEITLSGGGASSAMPHKQNPVDAEVLVSLARYNATLISAMHQAQVHEQERSGAAWTLEWLTLPQMAMTTGAGLRIARRLLAQVERIGTSGGGDVG